MKDIGPLIEAALPDMVALRRDLHRHPELGYEERRTAERILAHIGQIPGLEIQTGVAGTGIVATLGKDKNGPCVALRADMDALPMQEEADVPYKSRTPGKMHACGHDGHTTCLVGAVRVLAQCADELTGPVKFVFQPAEEGGMGGKRMCEEGVLEHPDVAAMFGLHGWPQLPQGQIGLRAGELLASTDSFEIQVSGTGAHAAFPHQGIDPVLIASHIVVALQSIVSRNTDPLDSAVVTVAQIHAGTAFNIIPPVATLKGTVRALDETVRAQTLMRLTQIATGVAEAMGGQAEVHIAPDGSPALYNDARAVDAVKTVVGRTGSDIEAVDVLPVMGGEDFAFYAQRIPSAFFFLGLRPPDEDTYPHLHQPDFDFADAALPIGIRMHVEIARHFAGLWGAKDRGEEGAIRRRKGFLASVFGRLLGSKR